MPEAPAPKLGHEDDCPECRQGKHANCTEWALDFDDNVIPCPCAEGGHL